MSHVGDHHSLKRGAPPLLCARHSNPFLPPHALRLQQQPHLSAIARLTSSRRLACCRYLAATSSRLARTPSRSYPRSISWSASEIRPTLAHNLGKTHVDALPASGGVRGRFRGGHGQAHSQGSATRCCCAACPRSPLPACASSPLLAVPCACTRSRTRKSSP